MSSASTPSENADGRYSATETKFEFKYARSQYVQVEFGAPGTSHSFGGMNDLDDRNRVAARGAFAQFPPPRAQAHVNPLAATLAVEPTDRRIDENSGERV